MTKSIEMPDVTGMSASEAKKTLKDLGIETKIESQSGENDENTSEKLVVDQLPKKGIQINNNATVTIYIQ